LRPEIGRTEYQVGLPSRGDATGVGQRRSDQQIIPAVAIEVACGADRESRLVRLIDPVEVPAARSAVTRVVPIQVLQEILVQGRHVHPLSDFQHRRIVSEDVEPRPADLFAAGPQPAGVDDRKVVAVTDQDQRVRLVAQI